MFTNAFIKISEKAHNVAVWAKRKVLNEQYEIMLDEMNTVFTKNEISELFYLNHSLKISVDPYDQSARTSDVFQTTVDFFSKKHNGKDGVIYLAKVYLDMNVIKISQEPTDHYMVIE